MPPTRAPARREPRPLLLTAAWAGVTTALVSCIVAIAVVAVLWLPAASGSGSPGSAIRAGILTFLAGVHGGITVDGVASGFVPLGLTAFVVVIVWRAGSAVAACADDSDEDRPSALLQAVALQSVVFAVTCAVLAAGSGLGTSSASVPGAFCFGLLLTALTAGAAMLRTVVLADEFEHRAPPWLGAGLRAAAAALAVYLAAGGVLVAVALITHHDRVIALSHEVGGGWSSVPVLVLGVLAAPNAIIAGAGYLSGAGFAVGTSTTASLTGATHGLVPAFPILGALPGSSGAPWPTWLLAAVTPLAAGAVVAAVAGRTPHWRDRWTTVAAATVLVAVLGAMLAWQGGGGIGDGKLQAVGTSPWQFALSTAAWVGASAVMWLAVRAGLAAARSERLETAPSLRTMAMSVIRDEREVQVHAEPDELVAVDADDPAGDETGETDDEVERPDHLAG